MDIAAKRANTESHATERQPIVHDMGIVRLMRRDGSVWGSEPGEGSTQAISNIRHVVPSDFPVCSRWADMMHEAA